LYFRFAQIQYFTCIPQFTKMTPEAVNRRSNTMTRLKDLIQNVPVHERRLEFRAYPLEDERLIVEGWLRDERLVPGYHWNGESRPTGVVHWMCVRLLVGGWPVTILDAEAEMPNIPHELCPTTLESVKRIVGLSIVSGTMGPAVLHGYWTQRSRQRRPIPRSLDEFTGLANLINSCKLWKEDGPFMQMIQEALEKQEEKSR
jgi:hypothetical protein